MLAYLRRKRSVKEWIFVGLQFFHFLVVLGFLWAGLVEFVRNPPFFDAYGDAATRNSLPEGLFENDPRKLDKSQSLRLMDMPILFMLIAYSAVCMWLKFKGLSWILTMCVTLVILFFFIVNYWAHKFFDWRYFPTRNLGLDVQVFTISLCGTMIFMVIFYERKRMPFKFKTTIPIRPLGKVHILVNFLAIFVVMFTCLILWFSKLYTSWACFKDHFDVMTLCERTTMVQCYPCDSCNPTGLKQCVKDKHKMYHCLSYIDDAQKKKGSFCIFNYNISIYSFLTVFAYVGGLVVFLSTFYRIVMHYIMRLVFIIIGWIKQRRTNYQGEHAEDLTTIASRLSHDDSPVSPYEFMQESAESQDKHEEPQTIVSVSSVGDLVDAMT